MLAGPLVSEVQAAVQALGYGSDTAAQQITLTALVQRRILAERRWPFLETQTAALATVAGTSTVALPTADLLHVHAVRIAIGTDYPRIDALDLQELRTRRHVDRVLACPDVWAQANGTIEFYPIPDKAYTIALDYSMHPAPPVAGTDVLTIPKAYLDVLVWGVIEGLATRQRDWNGLANAKDESKAALAKMVSAYNMQQRQSVTHVANSDFWNSAAR